MAGQNLNLTDPNTTHKTNQPKERHDMKTQTNPSAADTAQHTPEPWAVADSDLILGAKGVLVADCERTSHDLRPSPPTPEDMANARRIVSCVNACQGIANPGETIPAIVAALKGAESALFAALAVRCPGLDLEGVAKRHAATVAALAQLDSIRQP